jgi:hypothetical protein
VLSGRTWRAAPLPLKILGRECYSVSKKEFDRLLGD